MSECIFHWPDGTTKTYPLGNRILSVGSSEKAMVRIVDEFISPLHSEIFLRLNGVVLRDMVANNYTLINNTPLAGERTLKSGDKIKIGKTQINFQLNEVAPPENLIGKPVQRRFLAIFRVLRVDFTATVKIA